MNHDYNKIVYVDEKRNNALWIDWTLGNSCNFSCSYCPDNLHDGTANWVSLEDCLDLQWHPIKTGCLS